MYENIYTHNQCNNCGTIKDLILANGICGPCHYIIQHHLHAANATDVHVTGAIHQLGIYDGTFEELDNGI